MILIEAPSPASLSGMLVVREWSLRRGGDLNEILYYSAPILLRHRPACPQHVRLHPRPARRSSCASQYENRPGGLPENRCPVSRGSRRGGRVPVHLVLAR